MIYTCVTNGCFDLFHAGHYQFLDFCRNYKGKDSTLFTVFLDSDRKVSLDKGRDRPFYKYEERRDLIYQTGLVSNIIQFDTDEELKYGIRGICADVLFKGEDWKNKTVIGSEHVKELVFVPRQIDISTTSIAKRIKNEGFDHR